MTDEERQPMLFSDLPIPPAQPEAPRRAALRGAKVKRRHSQLLLDFDARQFSTQQPACDEDTEFDFPQHLRTIAGSAPPPETVAPSSIWALAAAARSQPRRRLPRQEQPQPAGPLYRVERDAGRVRVVRLRPEETEEWAERERQRRAKQRPPKPSKAAKTRGKKVRAWDGEAVEE